MEASLGQLISKKPKGAWLPGQGLALARSGLTGRHYRPLQLILVSAMDHQTGGPSSSHLCCRHPAAAAAAQPPALSQHLLLKASAAGWRSTMWTGRC